MSETGDIAAGVTALAAVGALVAGYVQFVLRKWLLPSVEFDVDFTAFCPDHGHVLGEVACVVTNTGSNMLVVTRVRCRMSYRCAGEGRFRKSAVPEVQRPLLQGREEHEPIEPAFPHPVEPFSSKSAWLLILPRPRGGSSTEYISAMPTSQSAAGSDSPRGTQAVSASISAISPGGAPAKSASEGSAPIGRSMNESSADRTFVQPGSKQVYRKPIILPVDAQLLHVWGAFDYRIRMSRTSRWLVRIFNKPPEDLDWRSGVENHTVRRTFKVAASGDDRT